MPTEENTADSSATFTFDPWGLLAVLWKKKTRIALLIVAAAVISIIVSLLLPKSYLAATVILPETDKGKLSAMGGLSDLASLAGVNVGSDGSLVKLYPTIIRSEAVLKNVITKKYSTLEYDQPVDLMEYWKVNGITAEEKFESALKALRDQLMILTDNKTSVITMTISSPEPQLSADILNEISSGLDLFIRNKRTTSAGEQRKFIEGRLVEVKSDLTAAENTLKEFREKNRQVVSPQLLLEQERLIRDVQINATLYTELRKQHELVKIEEVKNIPVINIMDPARPPARKDKPKRAVIVILSTAAAAIAVFGYFSMHFMFGNILRQQFQFVKRIIQHGDVR